MPMGASRETQISVRRTNIIMPATAAVRGIRKLRSRPDHMSRSQAETRWLVAPPGASRRPTTSACAERRRALRHAHRRCLSEAFPAWFSRAAAYPDLTGCCLAPHETDRQKASHAARPRELRSGRPHLERFHVRWNRVGVLARVGGVIQ
jgi:hypothetical protein